MSPRLYLVLNVFLLAGCGRTFPTPASGSGPKPEPDIQTEAARERVSRISGITLTPDKDARLYLTTSTTTLQLASDTVSSQVNMRVSLGFSVAYSRLHPSHTRITGALTHISVTAEEPIPTPDQHPDQQLVLPLEFTGHVESGGLHVDSLVGLPIGTFIDCQVPALNGIAGIRRNLVVPPLLLSTGATWTDSSTVPVCSGLIPLSLTAIRTYTVRGETMKGARRIIVVDRQDRVRATGEGTQGQHRVSILSLGSGSARIYLDGTTGFLHESEGTQTVDLIIGSSGRSQQFRQVVQEQTRLRQ